MWEGSYGKEPFDLRLTVLRFLRNLGKILLLTLAGTLLFGGGYYVKNVVFRPTVEYSATSTFKVEYTVPPVESNDYYINEMTWNTLVQSREFLEAVEAHLAETSKENSDGAGGNGVPMNDLSLSPEELLPTVSAKLPSDWNIPTVTVVTDSPEKSILIAQAVEKTMTHEFVDNMTEVSAVRVINPVTSATEVELDVRPVRAVVLSAILSFFFVTVLFLLKEIGDDSIWLPATIRRRYGLAVLGTINSPELQENIRYLFREKEKIAVCSVDNNINIVDVAEALREKAESRDKEWVSVPTPLLSPESCRTLREMDGILLAVQAGSHAGKPLEYVMEYLTQQDCSITAVILWGADELLINTYYCFGKEKQD